MTQPLYYKDLLSGQHNYTEQDLGRKGLSLSLLVSNNIPVPPFFILPPDLFRSIVTKIFQATDVTSLEAFRKQVIDTPFTPAIMEQIEFEYQKLSGLGKAWVAVRSSIVAPNHENISFSGVLTSMLNVRGANDIEIAVKDVFNSLFSDRSYDYLKRNGISYGEVSTAIVVQKMIQAEVSGIMYTYDPITLNQEHASIEAVFGLGDVLSDGNINPDVYTVSKKNLEIVEKKIVPQEWMKVRKTDDVESLEHLQKITISKMWQYSQKLDDSLVRELAKLAETIETALGGPQVIEWSMERGSLYVLQTKPMNVASEQQGMGIKDAHHKITSMKDIDAFSNIADEAAITVSHEIPADQQPVPTPPTETLIFTGVPASPGVAYGETLVITSTSEISEESLTSLKETTTKKHIIVTDEFNSTLEPLFLKAGGVITNFGGANSDAAITAREVHIPAIVGTRIATSFLQSGTLIKIDGSSGAVYRVDSIPEGTPEPTVPVFAEHEKTGLKKKILKKKKKHSEPLAKGAEMIESSHGDSPVKVFLTESGHATAEYIPTTKAQLPSERVNAVMFPVVKADVSEISYIKKLKRLQNCDIYLTISDIPSLEVLLSTKRSLAAHGIRRTKRIKFIVAISSMSGLLNTRNIADLGVDGFLFISPLLAASFMPGSTQITPELWHLISDGMVAVKNQKLSFLGVTLPSEYFTIPLRKELQPILRKGITALVFPQEMQKALDIDVQDMEKEMVKAQLGV